MADSLIHCANVITLCCLAADNRVYKHRRHKVVCLPPDLISWKRIQFSYYVLDNVLDNV